MNITNIEIAAIFNRIAEILEIQDENPFRIRAYRNAARTVQGLTRSLVEMVAAGEALEKLPGIGKDLAGKIREIVATGTTRKLQELEKEVAPELIDLLKVPGLGPKRLKQLRKYLQIKNIDDLEKAARKGLIRQLPGFGEKTEKNILTELTELQRRIGRFLWYEVEEIAEQLVAELSKVKKVKRVEMAGSYRRRRETVGDLDILAIASKDSPVMDAFVSLPHVERVISKGTTRSTVVLRTGLQVDLRVVPEVSFGAAWHYFTGNKAHNIAVRIMGVQRGLKINEYGVFDRSGKRIAGRTEEDVYKQLGLSWIEPELREKRGELEAATEGKLPNLIELEDLKGDLHCHTKKSDGKNTIKEMAEAAKELGHQYLAITEHTQSLVIARGLTPDELLAHCEAIDKLNESLKGIRILKGVEVDIKEDGSLDMTDEVMAQLDICVGAIHSAFGLNRRKQTERILRAMDNPYFNILAHPSARLIQRRPACDLDMETIMNAALERDCYLELNSQPERLDIHDLHCRMAKERGLKVIISSDAHSTGQLQFQRYGIAQARRGWLEKKDVLNSLNLKNLLKALKRS